MKKLLLVALFFTSFFSAAQSGYEITINMKNSKDTLAYLTFYQFDKTYIKDTCTHIKNGKITFKGKEKLNKGIYTLVSQQKSIYFDFVIDDTTQKLDITTEAGDNMLKELKATNSAQANSFFDYLRFVSQQNKDFQDIKQKTTLKTKKDTIALGEKQKDFEKNIIDYEENFIATQKGNFIADVLSMKTERILKDLPKDSDKKSADLIKYNYYKNHYWDGANFADDAVMRNPFFYSKLNRYFENVVIKHPDTVCVEIDRIMNKTKSGSLLSKLLIAHFVHTYETSKIISFDKVFVHISDNYFKTGKAAGIYDDEEVVTKIIKRADKIKPLLIGAKAQDLFMIKADDFEKMKAMGFESAKNSEEMTNVFYKNYSTVEKMFVKLSDVKAAYTLLLFWDVDCGHCQKEIPKILEVYNELLKEKKDVKVFSVYMQHEGEKYLKYLDEHKLPWINVYDGAHYNNTTEKYDVISTPVLYILDKDKVIKSKRIGAEQIKEIIELIEKENKEAKK